MSGKYKKLLYPVADLKDDVPLLEQFPDLSTIREFHEYPNKKELTKLFKYVAFLYDLNSPLIKEYKDLSERKDVALNDAGFDRNKTGEWSSHIQSIRNLHYEPARKIILRYLNLQNNMALDMIHYTEQLFSEYKQLLLRPVIDDQKDKELDSKDMKDIYHTADFKKKLRDECKNLKNDLEDLYDEVFKDNEDLKEEFKKHKSTPEYIAKLELA